MSLSGLFGFLSNNLKAGLIMSAVIGGGAILSPHALAAAQSPAPQAKISFTFDDGYASAISQAEPTLAKYGLTGTDYIITGCVGMSTAPNTCRANTDATYMTWAQIQQLQNSYGWEIGSHTVTHPYLATSDASDGQPNVLTAAQVTTELTLSKATLAANGINATDFATPYGDYNNSVLAQIAKYYASQRGFADIGANSWPYSDYFLHVVQVSNPVTVATVEADINSAITNKQWLILVLHDIKVTASKNADDYEYSTANLNTIAAYVKTKQTAGLIQPVNVNQASVSSTTNLLANSSFNDGIADGWSTDSPTAIKADSATNGSYPDPTNSIKLSSATTTAHLFSPKVQVGFNTTYMLKSFLNVQAITSGEVGYYVDEYNSSGSWISGQYKSAEKSAFVDELNFSYTPSSANVTYASLQVIVTANSGISAYLDNVQWFPLTTTTPVTQNIVASNTFDSGISGGWHTDDPANIVADSASHGSPANPVNSVKLTASTKNSHLFSPQVAVSSTSKYGLSCWLNIIQISGGEVGFYVDEYDASGNWISGQYLSGDHSLGATNINLLYKPTSANVKYASFQLILVGNSLIEAYFDNFLWYSI